jgi:F0F1-type ATP synthase membrane subunit a
MAKSDLDSRVETLTQAINNQLENRTPGIVIQKSRCFSLTIILSVIIPVTLFTLFAILFRKKKKNGSYTKQLGKSFKWTLGLSAIVWILLFCYSSKINNLICMT